MEYYNYLYPSFGKCIIISTSLMGKASMPPPHLWEMFHYFYLPYGKCIIFSTSFVGMIHCLHINYKKCIIFSTKKFGYVSLSLLLVREIYNYPYLHFGKAIIVCTSTGCIISYNSTVVYTAFSLTTMWEMKHFLHLTYGKLPLSVPFLWKCIIVSTSPWESSIVVPHLWKLHLCLCLTRWNCITVLPHLWEMHQAVYLTCEKCITGSK